MDRYIIACSGKGSRWNDYLNCKKQLLYIVDDILLHRTVKQIKKRKPKSEIYIMAFTVDFNVEGTIRWEPPLGPCQEHYDLPAIYCCQNIYNDVEKGRTTILFGDIYYTNNAMDKIIDTQSPLIFFGRSGPSEITLCKDAELWAVSFVKSKNSLLKNKLESLKCKHKEGKLWRFKTWELFWSFNANDKDFCEINDFTEDFDKPDDYIKWMKQYYLDKLSNKN